MRLGGHKKFILTKLGGGGGGDRIDPSILSTIQNGRDSLFRKESKINLIKLTQLNLGEASKSTKRYFPFSRTGRQKCEILSLQSTVRF